MLLILRSTSLFSSKTASPFFRGPVRSVRDPADLPEPVVIPLPVVTPLPVLTPLPDDCAVPDELVPGADGEACLDAFPAPLGSSLALLSPPGAAGPEGTPLTPCEPAPAEPALGEPAALPLVLPADDPPEDPPELCAREATGQSRMAMAVTAEINFIENLLFGATTAPAPCSCRNESPNRSLICIRSMPGVIALAQIDCLRR